VSYNGTGTFLINTAGQPVVTNTVISATTFNLLTADLANGLTNAITKDGQTTVTANIPMSNFKITGLGAATSANDAVRLEQLTSGATNVSFGNLAYTGTLTGGTGVINIGSGQIYKDASGNVGIGVTPSAWAAASKALQIGSSSAPYLSLAQSTTGTSDGYVSWGAYLTGLRTFAYATTGDPVSTYRQNGGIHAWLNAPSGTAGNAISFTQAMTLDASGNFLVGTTAADAKFMLSGSIANNIARFINTNASPYGPLIQYGSGIDPNGTSNEFIDCRGSLTTLRFSVRSNGGIANYSANNVNLSDRREKTNFNPAKNYLDAICSIPVQTFNYIDQNRNADDGFTLGVVAQDVQAVAPELVMESNWGTKEEPKMRLSIYQTDLQYALMKCIQEQQALIQDLTTRLAALEGN
jgi:hypothetical protein